jgi:hypothetical protein
MKKHLILTADDFGACDFIDEGIKAALKENIVNCVSTFVCFPDSRSRIEKLIAFRKEHQLDFNIGLHFSITAGEPLTNAKTMVKRVNGKVIFHEVHEHDFDSISQYELSAEVVAQYDALNKILKDHTSDMSVDHITHHHNVTYFFEGLFKTYVNAIKDLEVKAIRSPMPWHKTSLGGPSPKLRFGVFREPLPITLDGIFLGLKTVLYNFFSREFRDRELPKIIRSQRKEVIKTIFMPIIDQAYIQYPFCFCDTIYGQASPDNILKLIDAIRNFPEEKIIVEFMLHLGDHTIDPDDVDHVPAGINKKYFKGRQEELKALLGIDWNKILKDSNVKKTNFASIKKIRLEI